MENLKVLKGLKEKIELLEAVTMVEYHDKNFLREMGYVNMLQREYFNYMKTDLADLIKSENKQASLSLYSFDCVVELLENLLELNPISIDCLQLEREKRMAKKTLEKIHKEANR